MKTIPLTREQKNARTKAHRERRKAEGHPYHRDGKCKATPKQRAAHKYVEKLIRRGLLVEPFHCEACGKQGNAPFGRMDSHHGDYDKPAEVLWVCRDCHIHIHDGVDACVNKDGALNPELYELPRINQGISKFIGVSPGKGPYAWRAKVKKQGRLYLNKTFYSQIDAARARDAVALEVFGPKAILNFPIRTSPSQTLNPL